jgi:S1-C subfamily serine protease
MRRTALTLAGLLALLMPSAAQAQGKDLRRLVEGAQRAVVAINHRTGPQRGALPADTQARSAGFLISDEGHVLSAARFVEGRRRVDLVLYGGVRARADVVGVDPLNQIALLKLQARDRVAKRLGGTLPFLAFGRSAELQPGHSVFTLGNAFDSLLLDGTPSFSHGVVTSRVRAEGSRYRGATLEIDAAVNPGSFGGPVLDDEGKVVGVVTISFSARRWLGQAIPGDQIKLSVEALLSGQPPAHGQLGLRLRATGGEATPQGLEVVEVQPGSGAAQAGVRPGDRLLSIDGVRLYDTEDVARELEPLAPGSSVHLQVGSGSSTKKLQAILGRGRPVDLAAMAKRNTERSSPVPSTARREQQPRRQQQQQQQQRAKRPVLGARLTPRGEGKLGLRVLEVRPEGAGAKAGLAEGDVLMAVNRTRLRTNDDLRKVLGALRGRQLRLIVLRERRLVTLAMPLEPLAGAERPRPERPRPERTRPRGEPGFLGVFLDPESDVPGAPVDGAAEGSPAERAGLRQGDVIVAADGTRIANTRAFIELLGQRKAGDELTLIVKRPNGTRRTVIATLARRGEGGSAPAPAPARPKGYLGLEVGGQGGRLVIEAVDPRGPAAKAGLEVGDVILSAAGQPVSSLDALGAALSRFNVGQTVRLNVERAGWTKEFDITLSPRP